MLNDVYENGSSKLVLPTGRTRTTNFIYIIATALVILMMIVGVLILLSKNNKDKSGISEITPINSEVKINNLKNAKQVLDWLGTQRSSVGTYWANYTCDTSPSFTCKEKIVSNYTGIPVMWGMSKYYLATKDEKVLSTIKSDIKLYADDKFVTVGTYNLTCKLITDMMTQPMWNEEEKQSLKKICLKTDLIADNLTIYLTNKNDITLDKLTENIYSKLAYILSFDKNKKFSPNYTQLISSQSDLNFYPYMSMEYYEKYKLTYDKSYLIKSLFITDVLLENYITNKNMLSDLKCQTGRSLLSFRKNVDRNPHFDAVSMRIFEETKNMNTLDCVLLGSELYSATKMDKYKTFVKERLIDDGKYKFLQNNDITAFIFSESKNTLKIELDKNALLVGLLSVKESL